MAAQVGIGVEVASTFLLVGAFALLMAASAEIGRRIEKRRGRSESVPLPERPSSGYLMVHWLSAKLGQPGNRVKFRNACLIFGVLAIIPYIALLIHNRA